MREVADHLIELVEPAGGLLDDVPNDATPEMLTPGPMRSDGGAVKDGCRQTARAIRAPCAAPARARYPAAAVWSALSRPADADGVAVPPARGAFRLATS
jgi:hypothetical protein